VQQLKDGITQLIRSFDAITQLKKMDTLQNYSLTEYQFAQLIAKARMYQYLPLAVKATVPQLHFGDAQINAVCKDYYRDSSFCRQENGDINLWKLYNLFTATNKQSYIDTFLDRAVNASGFVQEICFALEHKTMNWFLS